MSKILPQPVDVVNFSTASREPNVQMGASIGGTAATILLITLFVLGFVATTLWGESFERLGDDVEAPYIFKVVGIGLIVFFLIAITFRLI
ncbi:hypothetical protein [Bradyrhizobium sp. Ce-3]|uniref:hypothetical protein n=1 Tax=Bradyrhizobium sp. Ce-3 TaxID=2913970 RepID=UPI001FC88123|nr:hypothetical protein [Bradyrhizobium sp. Ce-3]